MVIREGMVPGALGRIVQLHGTFYAREWGFGPYFEAKFASELAAFCQRQADPRDLVLLGFEQDELEASLILDLNDPESGGRGAHLRWFICSDHRRGSGVGRNLMQRAIKHVDLHADGKCWLTTFAGLDAARTIYEEFGFSLVEENPGESWGVTVSEQTFIRG
jgi:GNAT superfamily N-acetyltransferase